LGFGDVGSAGVPAGHHRAAAVAVVDGGWVAGPQGGGGFTQAREQVSAAGVGGVGVPGR
jgi:hypothetical protein